MTVDQLSGTVRFMAKKNKLQREQDQSFGHLLFTCARVLDGLAQAEVNRQAKQRVARPALMRLVAYLDFEGVRPTVLARQVDVSKQAIGVAVGELIKQGFAEYIDDPTDRRARLVRLTAAGGEAFAQGLSVLQLFEKRLTAEVGGKTMKRLVAGLQAIRPVLDAWSSQSR
jgi:DNA-binding MarR family transcriptional regulator